MADVQSPTATVDGSQALPTEDARTRRLLEEETMRLMAAQMMLLDPSRGYEIR